MAAMTDKEILKRCSGVSKAKHYKVNDQAIRHKPSKSRRFFLRIRDKSKNFPQTLAFCGGR